MEFNTQKSISLQAKLCNQKGLPLFAPSNGYCYRCYQQIYAEQEHIDWKGKKYTTGISTEKAGKSHITGCPHCNYSFCN